MSKYDDIINIDYSKIKKPKMSIYERSGQFAPFSALSGYKEKIIEVARTTNKKIILDENGEEQISYILNYINENIKDKPNIKITYFIKDKYKEGGKYITLMNKVLKIDNVEKYIMLENKNKVFFQDVLKIEIKE